MDSEYLKWLKMINYTVLKMFVGGERLAGVESIPTTHDNPIGDVTTLHIATTHNSHQSKISLVKKSLL
jgi:hypothetical protein